MLRSPSLLLIVLIAVTISGCSKPPERAEVLGNYLGRIHGAVESLELRADGSFIQKLSLPSGDELTASGSWHLGRSVVYFDGYLRFYDGSKKGALRPPTKTDNFGFLWASDMLIDDWGVGYYTLKKESNQPVETTDAVARPPRLT